MTTREDVAKEYDLDAHGCVKNHGRFEGEHYSTVLAYDIVMNGGQDDTLYWPNDTVTDVIALDDELRAAWDIEAGDTHFLLEQTDQGFVIGRPVDDKELSRITLECEKEHDLAEPEEE
jgi:hypothetical protein